MNRLTSSARPLISNSPNTLTASLLLLTLILLNACASLEDNPVVDRRGINQAQFEQDLLECRSYADEVNGVKDVAVGTATGAVIGGAVGAAVGNSNTAQQGAGAGAVLGGAKAGIRHAQRRQQIVQRCLRGRGYRILG